MKAVGNASECFTRMRSGIYGKLETILSLGIVSPLSAEHSRCIGAALSFASIFASLALAQEAGTIGSPADGTVIKPNGVFDFQNNTRADYSTSSYAFSVWLLTETPSGFVSSDVWCTGHYFGRFDEANYPAVPYATHPAPATLTMPDFFKLDSGYDFSSEIQHITYYLAVLGEWNDGFNVAGRKISLTYNNIIYNATI